MSSLFATLPANILVIPEPYKLEVPEEQIDKFRTLLRLSEVGPETWWSNPANGYYGITRQWLTKAKDEWLQFDWRKTERRINALPNFKIKIQSNGQPHDVHFAALFSARADAFPVILMHGWPGSFLEFLPFLELVSEKYSRNTLPWNIVVPSIPDYGLSVTQGQEAEMDMPSAAFIMNELMVQLGFKSGYAAQGGDVGSFLANAMAQMFPECIAFHRK
jgi:microsomal epoxide hydrolase